MSAKKYLGVAVIISAALALTACGEKFPTMTEEQYDQTVEYAVGLLMKYSNNGESKLTYVDPVIAQEMIEQQNKKQEEEMHDAFADVGPRAEDMFEEGSSFSSGDEFADASSIESSDGSDVENENEASEGSDVNKVDENAKPSESDEKNADEVSEGGSGEDSYAADPNAVVMSDDESREIMDDIFLSYQGYSISKTYPESSKSYVVNADKGKRLLVLRFDLYNASDNAKSVNMLKLNLLFQILLNGKNLGYTSVTFLPNDLSSYIGTIDSRAHESLVVLTQIDEKNTSNVENLGLIVTRDGKDTKVILK
ncbi:hypothetical protein D6853_14055 [Butyrivibrio sp. X503]|uniref:hypothetical protein n=1 Tax=Butyrivibrio sp. X503 TaxID=2364878 RepID=UPI000EA913B1|nr:hypothetical protein [Butyrivibrio sp. X503]RKM54061.1 hypothetical protein D6853_14055 [Butyrivibrio sp. X503]